MLNNTYVGFKTCVEALFKFYQVESKLNLFEFYHSKFLSAILAQQLLQMGSLLPL